MKKTYYEPECPHVASSGIHQYCRPKHHPGGRIGKGLNMGMRITRIGKGLNMRMMITEGEEDN